jgi:hypothetical protein
MPKPIRIEWARGHSPDDVADNLTQFSFQFQSRAIVRSGDLAEEIERYMKANAPWEDRTGKARDELYAQADRTGALGQGRFIILDFGHGQDVDYAIFLETMQAGRFAIVGPTLVYYQGQMAERVYGSKL